MLDGEKRTKRESLAAHTPLPPLFVLYCTILYNTVLNGVDKIKLETCTTKRTKEQMARKNASPDASYVEGTEGTVKYFFILTDRGLHGYGATLVYILVLYFVSINTVVVSEPT